MDPKFLRHTFRLSALTLAIVALSACGGGGSSGGGSSAPPATDAETNLPPGAEFPNVEETGFQSLNEAIAGYGPIKRQPVVNDATRDCKPSAFYIVSARKLQVGFRSGNGLSESDQIRLAKIAGLALDTTLTNYGFSGGETALQNSETLPYYVCIKAENSPLNTRKLLAELGPFDRDKGFYRQAKDQFANMFVERIRSTTDNYDEVYFWFDEGLSNFAGDNTLIGSPVTWLAQIAPNGPLPAPMSVERLPNPAAGSPSTTGSNYFKLYPFYATTVAFFLSDTGLGMAREELDDWLTTGVALSNFGTAFNQLGLGNNTPVGTLTFSQLKSDHVNLIKTWLDGETATTQLTDLTTADPALATDPVAAITIQRKPSWQFAPIAGYNLQAGTASVSFDSLTYTLADDAYQLYFRTNSGKCYGDLALPVANGKATATLSAATAKPIDCATIPL